MAVLSRGIGPDHTYEKVTTYGTPDDRFKRIVDEYQIRNGQVFVRRHVEPWPALRIVRCDTEEWDKLLARLEAER